MKGSSARATNNWLCACQCVPAMRPVAAVEVKCVCLPPPCADDSLCEWLSEAERMIYHLFSFYSH